MMRKFKILLIILLFSGIFTIHFTSKDIDEPYKIPSIDTIAVSFVPVSIIKEGNLNLNEYYIYFHNSFPFMRTKESSKLYSLYEKKGNYYPIYPLGGPLMAVLIYFLFYLFGVDLTPQTIPFIAKFSASFFCINFMYFSLPLLLKNHIFQNLYFHSFDLRLCYQYLVNFYYGIMVSWPQPVRFDLFSLFILED